MRRFLAVLLFLILLTPGALAADGADFGVEQAADALPEAAAALMEGQTPDKPGDLGEGAGKILQRAIRVHEPGIRSAASLCCRILAVVLLSGVLSSGDNPGRGAMTLAGSLAIGALCADNLWGLFSEAQSAVEDMTAFAGFLYMTMASATAATGAVGAAAALYGGTMLLCSLLSRLTAALLLPGISCCVALSIGAAASEDKGLKLAGDTLRQLLTNLLKLAVLCFTAYLSLTGVIRGSADTAAVKAAKLTISAAVPVVGSMIADCSETLLVSAGLVRSGLGVFGLLGVLAVTAGPFVETGCRYLLLKLTAAAAGLTGERELSDLISALAGAMGLLAGLTGACGLMLMIGCVCFLLVGG